MWKTSDLGWLKAIQDGCLSLPWLDSGALMTQPTPGLIPPCPQLQTQLSACPREAAGFHLQSHTTLPMGCAKPDPSVGWCSGDVPEARSWSCPRCPLACPVMDVGVGLWLAGPQRPLTAPRPETFHPLKLPDRILLAWYLIVQWRHVLCLPPRPDFIHVHENGTFLGLVLTDVTRVEGMMVWMERLYTKAVQGVSSEMGFPRCVEEESNLQRGL